MQLVNFIKCFYGSIKKREGADFMGFMKKGTPVQFTIVEHVCSKCKQAKQNLMIINGSTVCKDCHATKL